MISFFRHATMNTKWSCEKSVYLNAAIGEGFYTPSPTCSLIKVKLTRSRMSRPFSCLLVSYMLVELPTLNRSAP
jgi:hypothetical protein